MPSELVQSAQFSALVITAVFFTGVALHNVLLFYKIVYITCYDSVIGGCEQFGNTVTLLSFCLVVWLYSCLLYWFYGCYITLSLSLYIQCPELISSHNHISVGKTVEQR